MVFLTIWSAYHLAVGICFSSNHRAMEAEHVFELAVYADFHLSEEILGRFAKFLCSDDHMLESTLKHFSTERRSQTPKSCIIWWKQEQVRDFNFLSRESTSTATFYPIHEICKRDTETFFFPRAFPHQLACGLFGIEIPLSVKKVNTDGRNKSSNFFSASAQVAVNNYETTKEKQWACYVASSGMMIEAIEAMLTISIAAGDGRSDRTTSRNERFNANNNATQWPFLNRLSPFALHACS